MKCKSSEPSPVLDRFIEAFLVVEDTNRVLTNRMLNVFPGTHTEMVFSFGDAVEFVSPELFHFAPSTAYIGAQSDSPVYYRPTGVLRFVSAILTPLGLYKLTGIPQKHFRNRKFDLESVIGSKVRDVCEKIHEAGTSRAKVRRLEEFIAAQTVSVEPPDRTEIIIRYIEQNHGNVRLSQTLQLVGKSMRTTERHFKEFVGMPPKLFCRMSRFSHAYNLINAGVTDWGKIVCECGFFDQSHFIHEYQAFTGVSPGANHHTEDREGIRLSFRESLCI